MTVATLGSNSATEALHEIMRSRGNYDNLSSLAPTETSCSSDHLMALNMLRQDPATSWVFAVPSVIMRHKQCDQLPEDYRRAGIGHCMSGDDGSLQSLQSLQGYQSIHVHVKPKRHKMHNVIMRTVPFLLIMLN